MRTFLLIWLVVILLGLLNMVLPHVVQFLVASAFITLAVWIVYVMFAEW